MGFFPAFHNPNTGIFTIDAPKTAHTAITEPVLIYECCTWSPTFVRRRHDSSAGAALSGATDAVPSFFATLSESDWSMAASTETICSSIRAYVSFDRARGGAEDTHASGRGSQGS